MVEETPRQAVVQVVVAGRQVEIETVAQCAKRKTQAKRHAGGKNCSQWCGRQCGRQQSAGGVCGVGCVAWDSAGGALRKSGIGKRCRTGSVCVGPLVGHRNVPQSVPNAEIVQSHLV